MRNNIILILLFLVMGGITLQAQTVEKPHITYTADHQKYVLGGLTVDGIRGYDDDFLLGISGLEVGRSYEIPGADISQAIQNYWKQKLFSNVSIEADSIVGGKVYLRIRLAAQPRVSSINYNGVKKSEREDIEQRLGLTVGNQITPDIVDRAKKLIKRYFDEKGYKNAEVEIIQREDVTKENSMLVDVNINKNDKVRVNKIYVTGLDSLPKGETVNKLKRAMKKTHEKSLLNFFRSKKFIPEKYEEDKGYAIERLNGWGYRDALLVSDSVVTIDPKHVDIYMNFTHGQKYYVRNIDWVGNTVYTTDALASVLKMERGDVYDQVFLNKRLNSDEDAIGNQYYNNGYVFYSLDPVEINVEGDSIDLEMRISEGQQAHLNHIRISGNDRVYEEVIRRELRTKPGDLFTMEALQRSVRELASMNQFDAEILQTEIQKGIKPDQYTGTVDINYPLVTKGGDQIELSAGWGQTGIVGRVGLKFTNFSIQNLFGKKGYKRAGFIPQGDGQTLSLSGQTNGTYFQSYSLQFVDPWFGKKRPNQFSFSVYYSKQSDVNSNYYKNYSNYYNYYYGYGSSSNYYNYSNYYDPDKFVKLLGVSVGFGKRLRWPDDYFQFMAELSYTRYMLKNWQYFIIQNGNCNNFNLNLNLSRTSTDNTFFPRTGSELLLSATLTPPYSLWDGRDYKSLATNPYSKNYRAESQEKYRWIEYHKWKFKFRNFTALSKSMKHTPVLMTRAEVGILGSYNKYKKSPFESYYVGGDGMSGYSTGYATETIGLRGYENGSLGGANYDNAYAYTRLTMELRVPIMLETATSIYALAFAEAGNAWSDVKKMNPFSLKKSAGFGVRILLPMVGLMGIDWAYGFQKYNAAGTKIGGSQFHFIIGQEF
ncbi:MAG: outer membrane protein assembly factor BamA [Bacteroidaceae bacterium]|nr:outer membrane protein assembly factor BamA [Bacteroidaceae bacterium]